MTSAAFCRVFQPDTGVPARVVDKAVAVYRIVKRREIATAKFHILQTVKTNFNQKKLTSRKKNL